VSVPSTLQYVTTTESVYAKPSGDDGKSAAVDDQSPPIKAAPFVSSEPSRMTNATAGEIPERARPPPPPPLASRPRGSAWTTKAIPSAPPEIGFVAATVKDACQEALVLRALGDHAAPDDHSAVVSVRTLSATFELPRS